MTKQDVNEWNASVYHRVSNPHVGWGAAIIESLDLRGDEVVADVGCGTGRVTAQLLERLPAGRVVAIDRSANMLDEARNHLEPRFPGQVRFVKADLLTVTPDAIGGPVDLVFSTATFHWIRDHDTLFANLIQLVRPGGKVVAQCGGGPNLRRHVDRVEEMISEPPFGQFFTGWESPKFYADEPGTRQRMAAVGFIEIETSLFPAPTFMPDQNAFSEFMTNVVFREHLHQLPDDLLRQQLISELTERAAQDAPPFELDYWRLNLRGSRPSIAI